MVHSGINRGEANNNFGCMVPHIVYEECTLLTQNEVYTLYLHICISSLFMSNRLGLNTEPFSEQQLLNLVVYSVFFQQHLFIAYLKTRAQPNVLFTKSS